jgi:outer membrane protein
MGARELVQLARDAVSRAETQLSVSQARQKAGGALKTTTQLAAVEVESARLRVNRAEGEVRAREVAYERLVGEPPPKDMDMPVVAQLPAATECRSRAGQRNDARALRLLADQSRHLETATRGELWPTVDGQAGVTFYSFYSSLGDDITVWNARLLVTIPLFQSGAEYTRIRDQKIRTGIAELESARQARVIKSEIDTATSQLDVAQKAEKIADSQVKVATEHYDLISAQFKLAAVTILDVTNAQAVLAEAERQRTEARYEAAVARFQLLFACGSLKL